MSASAASERLLKVLEGLELRWRPTNDPIATLEVEREAVRSVLERLHGAGEFKQNTLVTAVDHHPRTPRFEVVWQFLSHAHNERVRVSCLLAEDQTSVPTCTDLWPGASFSERECWDMFGVVFDGHPDLRRLLMPADYDHHPLRKEFPHQGIEPDRLYREWDKARRATWQNSQDGGQGS